MAITTIEYALLAGDSYYDTRADINRFPIPLAWSVVSRVPQDGVTGFEASTYQNGTEIVISFAGTYDKDLTGDIAADIGLATGFGSAQLLQAAEYYLQVKAANTVNGVAPNITLTGHSLGGGLAALVGVFFGVEAHTFDQAPFANSAELNLLTPDVAANLRADLAAQVDVNGNRLYDDAALSGLTNFLQLRATNGGIPNSNLVTNINVQGEFLSGVPWNIPDRIGTPVLDIANSANGVAGGDLHAQALLTAFLQSDATAAAGKGLDDVTFKLPDLLKMIFDGNLFAYPTAPTNDKNVNLLEHLVRHQAGGVDGVAAGGDAMVTRFTSDLWKVAQDGGLTMQDDAGGLDHYVRDALIAFAMQKYYEEQQTSAGYQQELFTDLATAGAGSNGIRFDFRDVAADLNSAKGYDLYFRHYIDPTGLDYLNARFNSEERTLIHAALPSLRDWYVQAGASGMLASDTLNRGAFLLGGSGNDALAGGSKADLLVGNAGDDVLQGGGGNDVLLGGAGADTYVYGGGDGLDTLLDSDGQGSIVYDGVTLSGGAQYGDERVHRDADGHLYTTAQPGGLFSSGTLAIDGNLIVQQFDAGELGINFTAVAPEQTPATTLDILGDLAPVDFDPNAAGVQIQYDSLGNVIADPNTPEPDRADTLYDSSANDHITSGGGNDLIYAVRGGDDVIELAAGRDYAEGDAGNDIIIGGTGADILAGGIGDDRLYADTQTDAATAIAQGNSDTGTSAQGDWLAGGSGDDTLVAGADNDVLAGGGGNDLLIGGAGDDDILGDSDWVATSFTWSVTDLADGTRWFSPVAGTQFPADGAADVIYAGAGNDHAWGGIGNDVIFGEGGVDRLYGEEGNDIVMGGAGVDYLYGDGGNSPVATAGDDWLDGGDDIDYLYGGAGDDVLIGGKGDDFIYTGSGNDTIIYNRGDGKDTIDRSVAAAGDAGVVRFGAGIGAADIILGLGSLKLDLGNGDELHFLDFDRDDVFHSVRVGRFEFDDGSALSSDELLARGFDIGGTDLDDIIVGTNTSDRIDGLAGNDILYGGAGDDVIDGGTGDDVLSGDGGSDVYLFGRGAGGDVVADYDSDAGSIDTIRMAADVLPSDVRVTRDFHHLYLNIRNSADTITLENWFNGDAWRIERVEFAPAAAGQPAIVLDAAALEALTATPTEDNDFLVGTAGSDAVQGLGGNDIIAGGAGDDALAGGIGDDTYHFNVGDGQDVIDETSGMDTIAFGNGIGPGSLYLETLSGVSGQDLRIGYGPGSDSVLIHGGAAGAVEKVSFEGIGTFSVGQLIAMQYGLTSGVGSGNAAAADPVRQTLVQGGAGDDSLLGNASDTTFVYNPGDGWDNLLELGGHDTIQFGWGIGPGDVTVSYGGPGNDPWETNGPRFHVSVFGHGAISIANGEQGAIEQYRFADGTVLTHQQLLDLSGGINVPPPDTAGKTLYQSGSLVIGTAGNDVIEDGDIGGVTYVAGKGNDTFNIYAGNGYNYVFNLGDGRDRIIGELHSDDETIVFGEGITPQSLRFSETQRTVTYYGYVRTFHDLTIRYGSMGDSILVDDGAGSAQIEHFRFANGATYTYGQMRAFSRGGDPASGGNGGWLATDGDDFYSSDVTIGGPRSAYVDDNVDGLGGNDTLMTGLGNDTLSGGAGDDALLGGTGNDTYLFGRGGGTDLVDDYDTMPGNVDTVLFAADVLPFEVMVGRRGDNLRLGINGTTDSLTVKNWFGDDAGKVERVMFADGTTWEVAALAALAATPTEGDDMLYGGAGNDAIVGLGGNDELYGLDGNDTLEGGAGDDLLVGGAGNDTYVFNVGDGTDFIIDNLAPGENTLIFGAGFDPQNVTLQQGSLLLDLGNGDQVHIMGFDTQDAFNSVSISRFEFADGTVLTVQELLARGFDLNGAAGDDAIFGSNITDRLFGFGGNDYLDGGNGNDMLDGGDGSDTLVGGTGNDTIYGGVGDDIYRFWLGDGQDVITDHDATTGNVDVLRLENVLPADVTLTASGNDLVVNVGTGGDAVMVKNWLLDASYRVERIEFYDGTVWDEAAIAAVVAPPPANRAPLASPIAAQTATPNSAFSFTLPAGTFTDPDGDALTLGAGLANGSPLPGWLTFDVASGRFSGTPGYGDAGSVDVAVTATDDGGLAATGTFALTVAMSGVIGGAGDDTLTGTAGNDTIYGLAGNDALDGGNGNDVMVGGTGDDVYTVNSASDLVVERAGEGVDTVRSNGTHTLEDHVENLTLLSWDMNYSAIGNALDNVLTGNAGSNMLDGKAGADTMLGGYGSDYYMVDNAGDVVIEAANAGTDEVSSSISYVLPDNVERLFLVGTAAIDGTGNALNNTISGNGAANIFAGGLGDDTYTVGFGDTVVEYAGEGTDTVSTSISYVLPDHVENLTLTGANDGTGNALNNFIQGSESSNVIDGGAGADTMMGGGSNDTYIVDDFGDVVVENQYSGTDTVQSSVSYTLSANVENLILTGTAAINGTGNDLNNVLTGNDGANLLSGLGGNDTLQGKLANDILQGGSGNDTLADTGGNNLLHGGDGNDAMTGASGRELFIGGTGNDTITTGNGADIVAFNSGDGQDTVAASSGVDNTLSLGGGITYQNLALRKSGNDLVLGSGGADQITLQGWYANPNNRSIASLQVILDAVAYNAASADPLLNRRVQRFDFGMLAGRFDQALAADPALSSWNLTNALLDAHLAGSDTEAIGGDLAYQYGANGTLAGIGLAPAQAVLADANFGTAPQALQPLANLQVGAVRLS